MAPEHGCLPPPLAGGNTDSDHQIQGWLTSPCLHLLLQERILSACSVWYHPPQRQNIPGREFLSFFCNWYYFKDIFLFYHLHFIFFPKTNFTTLLFLHRRQLFEEKRLCILQNMPTEQRPLANVLAPHNQKKWSSTLHRNLWD